MMEYKRLTGKSECGYNNLDACLNCDLEMDCGLCPYWAEALDRLAELEDKMENGTLIELGYHIRKSYRNQDDQRYKIVIVEENDIDKIGYDCLTREEAEKRLKELQNG